MQMGPVCKYAKSDLGIWLVAWCLDHKAFQGKVFLYLDLYISMQMGPIWKCAECDLSIWVFVCRMQVTIRLKGIAPGSPSIWCFSTRFTWHDCIIKWTPTKNYRMCMSGANCCGNLLFLKEKSVMNQICGEWWWSSLKHQSFESGRYMEIGNTGELADQVVTQTWRIGCRQVSVTSWG